MYATILASWRLVWWRHRRGLTVIAAVWLVLAGVAQVMPPGTLTPALGGLLVVPVSAMVLVYVVYALAQTENAILEERESGFPARLFTLPVRTATLVAWKMLFAAGALGVIWVAWAGGVLRPAGLDVPLVWPAFFVVACQAWLQVLIWWPAPVRFFRLWLVVLWIGLGILMMHPIARWGSPALGTSLLFAGLTLAAYGAAVVGVTRARHGDTPQWTWPARLAAALAALRARAGRPFATPLRAQTWLEWRQRGYTILFMVGLMALVWVALLPFVERGIGNLATSNISPLLSALVRELTAPGVFLTVFLPVTPLWAGTIGAELGGMRMAPARSLIDRVGCSAFLALQPLTTGELVRAKYWLAARSTLIAWAVILILVLLWLVPGGRLWVLAGAPILQPYSSLQIVAAALAALAGLVVFTWLQLVGGLWVTLTGRDWLALGVALSTVAVLVGLPFLGHWLYRQPELLAALAPALPILLAGVVVLKLLLALVLGLAMRHQGLTDTRGLGLTAAGWTATAAGCAALASWLAPPLWAANVALVTVLLVPLNRFAAAPLALHWNRHR